jgi:hypothetical protein
MTNNSATMEMTDEEMIQFFDLDSPTMASHQQPATTPLNDNLWVSHFCSIKIDRCPLLLVSFPFLDPKLPIVHG